MRVGQLLAEAREQITRVAPWELRGEVARGALAVDIRPETQRRREGELGFGVVVERNVLEWRFDLEGPHCIPEVQSYRQHVVVVCSEGYASSLAAATLRRLGYIAASDLEGGFLAWQDWTKREGAKATGDWAEPRPYEVALPGR